MPLVLDYSASICCSWLLAATCKHHKFRFVNITVALTSGATNSLRPDLRAYRYDTLGVHLQWVFSCQVQAYAEWYPWNTAAGDIPQNGFISLESGGNGPSQPHQEGQNLWFPSVATKCDVVRRVFTSQISTYAYQVKLGRYTAY